MNKYFAICPRGLEELLAEELRAVGGEELKATHGGVFFAGDWSVCYRANLESRLATRILWHIVKGRTPRKRISTDWPSASCGRII
jgi:putative N6-adenine-specific DNA methylase